MKAKFASCSIDSRVPELRRDGEIVQVEPKVLDILLYLIENRDRIVSKDELIASVWHGRIVSDAAVTSRINLVRQAVGDTGRAQEIIRTHSKRGFRFVSDIEFLSEMEIDDQANHTAPGLAPASEVSVLVLPFKDLSPDGSGFLATGLTEDLIVALSRYSDVAVISLNTALLLDERATRLENPLTEIHADYLINGTIRLSGAFVRVTVQLSERATGATVYSDKFDREMKDLFALMDELVQALAGCLPWRVIDAVGRRMAKQNFPKLSTYHEFIKAGWQAHQHNDILRYMDEVGAIVARDPDFALAQAEHAFLLGYKVYFTGQQEPWEIEQSVDHARKAVKLAPDNERVLAKSAMAFQFAGHFSVAMRLSEQAIRLNPNSTDCTHFHGTILGASGDAEAALVHHRRTQALDPLFPEQHYEGIVEALYLLGRYHEGLEIIDRWSAPGRHIHAYAGAFLAMVGDHESARKMIATFEESAPYGYSNAAFVGAMLRYHKLARDREHWLRGFETAGLSEMNLVREAGLA